MKKQLVLALRIVVVNLLYFLPIPFLAWSLCWFLNWLFMIGRRVGCIFIQAFGRNSYSDKELVSILTPILEKASGDVIKAFVMLQEQGFDPGKSNLALAKIALKLYRRYSVPIIAQWEVVYAIWLLTPRMCELMVRSNHIFTLWARGEYYPTYEVKKDSIAVMRKWGLTDPLELAQPDMAIRALMIIWRLGITAALYIAWVPYDWKSVQIWTKTFLFWSIKEPLVHGHHVKWGWVAFHPPKE